MGRTSVYHLARLARLRFDYAPCHVAMAARREAGRLREARLIVTGTRGRFRRLEKVERWLEERPAAAGGLAADALDLPFAPDPRFSAQYRARWARVQILDGRRRMEEEAG